MSRVVYYPGGYVPTAPAQNKAEEWAASGYTAWDASGAVSQQRPLTAAEQQRLAEDDAVIASVANTETLHQQATQALTVNRTYIGRISPTAAQTTAQVQALSRQNNGLIRLLLGLLDATD